MITGKNAMKLLFHVNTPNIRTVCLSVYVLVNPLHLGIQHASAMLLDYDDDVITEKPIFDSFSIN